MTTEKRALLLVEDEALARAVQQAGYEPVHAAGPEQARERLHEEGWALVLVTPDTPRVVRSLLDALPGRRRRALLVIEVVENPATGDRTAAWSRGVDFVLAATEVVDLGAHAKRERAAKQAVYADFATVMEERER